MTQIGLVIGTYLPVNARTCLCPRTYVKLPAHVCVFPVKVAKTKNRNW